MKGLKPDSTYFYKVKSDEIESKVYSFHTYGKKNFTFIVYGDCRGTWDKWRNATKIAEAIAKEKADFVINTGDMVRYGKNEEEWASFLGISKFMHNVTLYPAMGNHDLPPSSFTQYFSLPNNEQWYSFDYGNAHFVILNSNFPYSFLQFIWLLKNLETDKIWNIIVFHHPPYSSGYHGNSTLPRLWLHLFERKGIDIVFNGHDHDYERLEINGIKYIVTGGGGAPLYEVGRSKWTILSQSTYHYCKISINSSSLHFTSLKPDGEIIDDFVINKHIHPSIIDLIFFSSHPYNTLWEWNLYPFLLQSDFKFP